MKKKYTIMLCVLLVAIAAAVVCIIRFLPEKEEEGSYTHKDYSISATNFALQRGSISNNEILLMDSSTEGKDGNIIVTFRIYTVAEGYSASYFMDMPVADANQNPGLNLVGNATATFRQADPKQIFGLNIFHDR